MKIVSNQDTIKVIDENDYFPLIILRYSYGEWTVASSSALHTDIERSREIVKAFQLAFDELDRIQGVYNALYLAMCARELALVWDYVPDPDEAVTYPDEYQTEFSSDFCRKAAEEYGGWSPSELTDEIIKYSKK